MACGLQASRPRSSDLTPTSHTPRALGRHAEGGSRELFYHTQHHPGRGSSQNETMSHFERTRQDAWS